MGASASPLPVELAVDPGGESAATVRIKNRGQVVDQFTFQVLGEAGEWTQVVPPQLSLFPGTESAITLRFQPPRVATLPPGLVPFALRVSSAEDPDSSFVQEGSLVVAPFQQTAVELSPRTSRGRRSGKHELAFDNFGNVGTTALVSATDNENALVFRVEPPELRARPGHATLAKVHVRPRRRFLRGPDRIYPFQLHVRTGAAEPANLDGMMVQKALLPRVSFPAALLVAAAVVVWAVLKPDAESTAKNATGAQAQQRAVAAVASARKAAESAQSARLAADSAVTKAAAAGTKAAAAGTKAAAAGTKAAAAGATAAAAGAAANAAAERAAAAGTAGKNAGAKAAAAGAKAAAAARIATGAYRGTPTGFRPSLSCPPRCDAQIAAPKGRFLSLTDVALENAAGDRGTLALTRAGEPLLLERLDDFRNVSFSLATPIVLAPNERLTLRVTCENAKGSPCTSSAYVGGFVGARPAVADPGQPTSIRVAVSCPPRCVARLRVPTEQSLALSDIIFTNAGGDKGVARLQRGKDVLLAAALDGMQNLPYRFAAPIVVGPGETVALTVTCENPGTRSCTAAAYLGGLQTKTKTKAKTKTKG
jgi:hypothetical protein